MKNKLTYPIFAFLVVLLASASFVTAVAPPPNTSFATGDLFHYTSFSDRDDYWNNKIILANPDDDTDIYRYQENWNDGFTTTEGDLELFLIKPDANLPDFVSPEGPFDHVLLVDFWGMSVAPSNRSGGDKFYDAGGSAIWENNTYPVEDTTGRYESNDEDGEEWMPVVSNATYLIQMSEMTDPSIYFDTWKWLPPGMDLGSFDGEVPLTSRSITSEPVEFTINGVAQIIDTNYVVSTFEISNSETYATQIPIGDENDPNAWTNVNATVDIWVYESYYYYFDATTGMLLEMSEVRNFGIDMVYYNSSLINTNGGPATMSVYVSNTISSFSNNVNSIDEASSFYGNTRPVSSGTNRLQEGDMLTYDSDSSKSYQMNSDSTVGDSSTFGWESHDSNWGEHRSVGTGNFDVYRHQPGFWDAVMYSESTSNGSWGYDSHGIYRGEVRDDFNTSTEPARDFLNFEYMNFQSTADEEIVHWFDNNMWFDDDFIYDEGDGWRLDYNRRLPKVGLVNDTTWHADLDSTGDGGEPIMINGFAHTWFNVQMYSQQYGTTYNQLVEIPMFRDNNGDAWINVTLSGDARGEQSFFYDNQTGVLVHMEQRTEVNLYLNGTGSIWIYDEANDIDVLVSVTFDAYIRIEDKFSITISAHPHEYLTAEAADPVDHSAPVDTTPADTTTPVDTTPVDSNTTSEAAPGLDLPIPVSSVVVGIMAIPVLLRLKKKHK